MYENLETATNPESLRRVVIDPVTRVEGHGKVTLLLDEDNHVKQARLHIVEFRGFERFIQGRPYWELPVMVQRLCGICPVSHHLAAAKAVDQLVGVDRLTPTAEKLRRLMHYGQTLQSHALHFFHLSTPDLLFGFDDQAEHRNIVSVLKEYPELGLKGVNLRKYGQEVIRVVSGKRVHGTAALPGGMNKALTAADRDFLLKDIDEVTLWADEIVELIRQIFLANPEYHQHFGNFPSNYLGLAREDGAFELYHGGLRARDEHGKYIFDHVDYRKYPEYLREEVRSWTYMKFPHIVSLGRDNGWYRVGPLARLNNCDFISTPRAEAARRNFIAYGGGNPVSASLAYHWARMIELLYCAEAIHELLEDPELLGTDLVTQGEKRFEGVGVVEAPRGTLFHHYCIDENDLVTKANLIVSTTNNNQAMNEAVRAVAARYLDGQELTEGLLNHLEVAIRAYDPCLSCATHALGKMPLELELLNAEGARIDRLARNSQGEFCQTLG
ncbi:Ni/Fe hydrogenase subunit alpha [Candidatus Methylospira mobilis]|uniref:Ni/Fe hydrogenase subunit alpha n=1 Tax=Candidatus Methylospira mobilis TaxID=1808979 RepID=A0A5Q0BLV3_9GAMM|nr:Ni/Fe hydrogenase subunit alpha [Candidatus Methylospira mobilis]QFY44813.1 Ni/Fe hydrogenase subunit alpha [Candidatus Methylospira mobilis]WNV05642.1 Ni/Fe hydrogenase subunit alpha [Candidatus Methylospira mobilis]